MQHGNRRHCSIHLEVSYFKYSIFQRWNNIFRRCEVRNHKLLCRPQTDKGTLLVMMRSSNRFEKDTSWSGRHNCNDKLLYLTHISNTNGAKSLLTIFHGLHTAPEPDFRIS